MAPTKKRTWNEMQHVQNEWALLYASNEQRDDKEAVLRAVNEHGRSALHYASKRLKNDRYVVLQSVKKCGHALSSASQRLQDNKEVVLEAVRQNGWALLYASKRLKHNREVVLEAVRQNGPSVLLDSLGNELHLDRVNVIVNDVWNWCVYEHNMPGDVCRWLLKDVAGECTDVDCKLVGHIYYEPREDDDSE